MTDFSMAWLGIMFASLTWQMSGEIFVFCMVVLLIAWVVVQSVNPESEVSLKDLFLDPRTRKIGTTTMRTNVAFIITTFLYGLVVIKDSAQFIPATTVYAGLWIIDKARSSFFDSKDKINANTDNTAN